MKSLKLAMTTKTICFLVYSVTFLLSGISDLWASEHRGHIMRPAYSSHNSSGRKSSDYRHRRHILSKRRRNRINEASTPIWSPSSTREYQIYSGGYAHSSYGYSQEIRTDLPKVDNILQTQEMKEKIELNQKRALLLEMIHGNSEKILKELAIIYEQLAKFQDENDKTRLINQIKKDRHLLSYICRKENLRRTNPEITDYIARLDLAIIEADQETPSQLKIILDNYEKRLKTNLQPEIDSDIAKIIQNANFTSDDILGKLIAEYEQHTNLSYKASSGFTTDKFKADLIKIRRYNLYKQNESLFHGLMLIRKRVMEHIKGKERFIGCDTIKATKEELPLFENLIFEIDEEICYRSQLAKIQIDLKDYAIKTLETSLSSQMVPSTVTSSSLSTSSAVSTTSSLSTSSAVSTTSSLSTSSIGIGHIDPFLTLQLLTHTVKIFL